MTDDFVRSTPKSSHLGKKVTRTPKATPRTSHPGKNLGKYLHKSKMPTGAKIGVGTVKIKKPRKPKVKKVY